MILPLWPLLSQFQYRSGANLVAGRVYIFYQGRTRLAPVYKNEQGIVGPNPIILDADGRGPCFVDSNYTYTVVVTDARGKELFSQDMSVDNAININDALSGDSKLYIINSDGTISVNATSGDTWIQYDLGTFNKPLGVQAPLYWAQDDEECSIIGASGLATTEELAEVSAAVNRKIDTTAAEVALSGKVNVNDFTAYQEEIESAFGAVSDDVNVLSGVIDNKLDTSSFADVSGSFITAHQSLEGYLQNSDLEISDNKITGISGIEINGAAIPSDVMTEDKISYDGNGKISAYNGSAFVGEGGGGGATYSAGDYIDITNDIISVTGLQPSGDYVFHDELTSYATQADLTGLATKDEINDKLDESAFANVSGSFYSTANPSGFITGVDLSPYQTIEGMTAYQPAGDYATQTDLSNVSGAITAMIPTGEFELCAGSGIELVDDPNAKTTTISVTAQGGNPEVEAEVIAHSADWNTVGDKLDTTAFSDVSGTFLTAHQNISDLMPKSESANFYPMNENPSGYLTAHQDLSDYQTIEGMTAYQVVGDYYSASNPSGFITGVDLSEYALSADVSSELSNKLDTTAFGDVSGDFLQANDITGKQDIEGMTAYQTVAGMTAYQPTGDYLTTSDSANFYTTANESGYLTAVPDTYLQNTDLTLVDNKITEISGIPLSAGDELPESVSGATDYITANSGIIDGTVETVSSNSGTWGGEPLPISSRDGIDLELTGDMLWIGASAINNSITGLNADKLDVSAFNEFKASYDALSALFAQYSGQWLLPNEGV